jgi:hypothetical protein
MTSEQLHDRMLYVLTAQRKISWANWKKAFDALYLMQSNEKRPLFPAGNRYDRNATARALDSLGHCELDFTGTGYVAVAVPVLARLPRAGLPQAVLCGARSPKTLEQLKMACVLTGCRLEILSQRGSVGFLPLRVVVEADTVNGLEALAQALSILCETEPPAWGLLHFVRPLDSLLQDLKWQTEAPLNWWKKTFDPCHLNWTSTTSAHLPSMVLLRYIHPRRQTKLHILVHEGQAAEIDLDWGRYAVLRQAGLNVLVYHDRSYNLAVPQSAPLPRLLARALTLCSGFAPWFLDKKKATWPSPECHGFDVYRLIPPEIACAVAKRLGQQLVMQEFSVYA